MMDAAHKWIPKGKVLHTLLKQLIFSTEKEINEAKRKAGKTKLNEGV